jgi:hypothetical protein
MIGTANCIYETPCGWCSKWDKKCDRKAFEEKPCNHAWIEEQDLYRDEIGKLHKVYKCIKCHSISLDSAW